VEFTAYKGEMMKVNDAKSSFAPHAQYNN